MTQRTLRTLAAIVIGLVAILYFLETDDRQDTIDGALLFPDLRATINDVTAVTVVHADDEQPISVINDAGRWLVDNRSGYRASVGKIREVLLAIADAKIIEEKTSNPDRYGQLGVQGPGGDGSDSIQLTIAAPDTSFDLIIGKTAQQNYRYVRIANEAQSFLIDKNPDVPTSAGDWLLPEIVDIDASRVRAVVIEHEDGEKIRVSKASSDVTDYSVDNIPEGRELSYATVANGMAGALGGLTLEEVRKSVAAEAVATTTYETFDGLRLTVSAVDDDGTTWVSFNADTFAVEAPDESEEPETEAPDPAEEATRINARVAGWQYRLPDYKQNLLMRRWDDILKSE